MAIRRPTSLRRRRHPMVRPQGFDRLRKPGRRRWRARLDRLATVAAATMPTRLPDQHGADAHVSGAHARSEELARLEAVLFLAREPLNTRRLAKLARLADGTRARVLVRELDRLLDATGSAFRVEQVAGGFQLLSRAAFGPWLRRLLDAQPQTRLSAPAMETLAIVAYRQPVSRAEIEAVRGVGCEEMLRQLLDRDLVAIGGRSEEIGRPNLYVTTRHFLRAFGLGRLEDLPPISAAVDLQQPS